MHTAFEVLITGLNRSGVNAFLGRYPVIIAVLKNLQHERTSVFSLLSLFYKAYDITSRGLYSRIPSKPTGSFCVSPLRGAPSFHL